MANDGTKGGIKRLKGSRVNANLGLKSDLAQFSGLSTSAETNGHSYD